MWKFPCWHWFPESVVVERLTLEQPEIILRLLDEEIGSPESTLSRPRLEAQGFFLEISPSTQLAIRKGKLPFVVNRRLKRSMISKLRDILITLSSQSGPVFSFIPPSLRQNLPNRSRAFRAENFRTGSLNKFLLASIFFEWKAMRYLSNLKGKPN